MIKLDDLNYIAWSDEMTIFLQTRKLTKVILNENFQIFYDKRKKGDMEIEFDNNIKNIDSNEEFTIVEKEKEKTECMKVYLKER